MTGRLGHVRAWARQAVLTVGAVAGVACILVTLGAALFGLRPLVFESGSMAPTIHTGDLAISRSIPASSLEEGQIVSVPTGTGSRVTHRIVSITRVGDDAILQLRGDANDATDATHYRVSHADRVLFHVPRVGYAVGWLSGPMGIFALGLYAAFLVSVLFRRSPAAPARLSGNERVVPPSRTGGRRAGRRRDRATIVSGGLTVVLAVGVLSGLAVRHQLTPTLAAWLDPSSVTGTSLTADTVLATTLTCTKAGSTARFSWTTVPNATNYTISFAGGVAKAAVTQATTTYSDLNPSSGRVARVVVNRQFSGVTWSSVASNARTETSNNGQCS